MKILQLGSICCYSGGGVIVLSPGCWAEVGLRGQALIINGWLSFAAGGGTAYSISSVLPFAAADGNPFQPGQPLFSAVGPAIAFQVDPVPGPASIRGTNGILGGGSVYFELEGNASLRIAITNVARSSVQPGSVYIPPDLVITFAGQPGNLISHLKISNAQIVANLGVGLPV